MDKQSVSRREFLRIAALSAAGAALAGCSTPPPTPETVIETRIVERVVEREGEKVVETVVVTQEVPTEIIRISVTDAPGSDADPVAIANWNSLLEQFYQMRPDVAIEPRPGGYGGRGGPEGMAARIAAGVMATAEGVWLTEPQKYIQQGVTADITDILVTSEYGRDLSPMARKPVQNAEGRDHGITTSAYVLALCYNRKMLEAIGLDPNSPPTTWDSFRAAAKAITDEVEGAAGYAECGVGKQAGWRYTSWVYSGGGDMEVQEGGAWRTTLDCDAGKKWAQQLYDMCWVDGSLTENRLIQQGETREYLALGQVGMIIQGSDALNGMFDSFPDTNPEDFGVSIHPQDGGNATLMGGYAFLFNAAHTPAQVSAAVDFILFRYYDLGRYEENLKTTVELGNHLGAPGVPIFVGETQAQRDQILAKYANLPVGNYKPFVEGMANITGRTEPTQKTQDMYAAVGSAIEAILTDQNTDPIAAIEEAAKTFQALLDAA